jgi:hypothetical protein
MMLRLDLTLPGWGRWAGSRGLAIFVCEAMLSLYRRRDECRLLEKV